VVSPDRGMKVGDEGGGKRTDVSRSCCGAGALTRIEPEARTTWSVMLGFFPTARSSTLIFFFSLESSLCSLSQPPTADRDTPLSPIFPFLPASRPPLPNIRHNNAARLDKSVGRLVPHGGGPGPVYTAAPIRTQGSSRHSKLANDPWHG
jgi:hypothetical protein